MSQSITVIGSELQDAVSFVAAAAGLPGQGPLLSNIRMTSEDGTLVLQATNYEAHAIAKIPVMGLTPEEFDLGVPAQLLEDALKRLPKGDVTLTVDRSALRVECGKARHSLITRDMQDFPTISSPKTTLSVPDGFFEACGMVSHAVSNAKEQRKSYAAINVIRAEGYPIAILGTNSHYLCVKEIEGTEGEPLEMLVPQGAVSLVESAGTASCTMGGGYIKAEGETKVVVANMLAGQALTSFRRVVPDPSDSKWIVDKTDLLGAIARAMPYARANADYVELAHHEDGLRLYAFNLETGQYEEVIDASATTTEGFRTAMDIAYLKNTVAHLPGNTVVIEVTAAMRPLRIYSVEDPSYYGVIMPMSLRN